MSLERACEYKFIMNMKAPESNPGVSCISMYRFTIPNASRKFSIYFLEMHFVRPDVCAVKFYPKVYKEAKDRYRRLTAEYRARLIIDTCFKICLDYLEKQPTVSFSFVGINGLTEDNMCNTKRFRIYSGYIANLLSTKNFHHLYDKHNSAYLLLNKSSCSAKLKDLDEITKEFTRIYQIEIDWLE